MRTQEFTKHNQVQNLQSGSTEIIVPPIAEIPLFLHSLNRSNFVYLQFCCKQNNVAVTWVCKYGRNRQDRILLGVPFSLLVLVLVASDRIWEGA